VPILVHHLGTDNFGIWNAALAIAAWIAVLDLGFGVGLTNCLAASYGRNDEESGRRYVASAFLVVTAMATLLGIVLAFVAPRVDWQGLIGDSSSSISLTLSTTVLAALAAAVIALPTSLATGLFAGMQLSYIASAFFIAGQSLAFGLLLLGTRLHWSMPTLLFSFVLAQSASSGLSVLYGFGGPLRDLRPQLSDFSPEILRDLARRSAPLFLYQIGATLVNQTQVLVIAHRLNLNAVSSYAVLTRMLTLLASLIFISTTSFLPAIREAHERGDSRWARKAFSRLLRIRLVASAVSAILLILVGNSVVSAWTGSPDFRQPTAAWVTLALLLVTSAWVTSWTELSTIMDRTWRLVPLVLANGFGTLFLTWLAAPRYGIPGVFVASTSVSAVALSWILPLVTRRALSPLAESRVPIRS